MSEAYGRGPYKGPELDALGSMLGDVESHGAVWWWQTARMFLERVFELERRVRELEAENARRNGKGTDNGT